MKLNKKKIYELALWTTIMTFINFLLGIDIVIIVGLIVLITKE